MPAYPAVVPGYYNPEVEIFRGYWLLSWFKREFATKEVAEAKSRGISAEELLNARLREVPPGSDGLVVQPYFTPGLDMPFAKGSIIGFSDVHTRIHLYRALIEGINFALMTGLRGMEKRGGMQAKRLYVAGGGSQSAEICQITASQFGLPVYRTQTHEVTAIGAAMTAFVAEGVFSSYAEGIEAMVHIQDEFIPDPKTHSVYEELYSEIFEKIFEKLSPLYAKMGTSKVLLGG
jgi:sugar (pentulose or hexulose) kinase